MRDSVENLVTLFEHGTLNRQQLIQGLLAAIAPFSVVANAHADTSTTSTFRGRSLNHVTLSVTDVERSKEFYSRLLGGRISFEMEKGTKVEGANLALADCFMGLYKLGEPRVHHFCVGVEHFSIDSALEKLKSDFPESKPTIYRGEELYFRDPDRNPVALCATCRRAYTPEELGTGVGKGCFLCGQCGTDLRASLTAHARTCPNLAPQKPLARMASVTNSTASPATLGRFEARRRIRLGLDVHATAR